MKNVVITGGSRGIGAAAVELFASRGHRVWFLYEKEHAAAEAVAEKTGATPICCDVADGQAVKAAFEAIGDVDSCMFCPADQPLLRRETVASLAMCAAGDPQSIWRLSFGDHPGSPVIFPRWAFDGLRTLPEGKGGAYVAKQHPERVRLLPVADGHELMDADDRETFAWLLQMASQPQG